MPQEQKQKDDYNFFEEYPTCGEVADRPPQLDNDCYAHATAYAYSLRNCMLQSTQVGPDSDILVRTHEDALRATYWSGSPCGTPQKGGQPNCVASFWQRADSNPARILREAQFEAELKKNGPITATIDWTRSLEKHVCSHNDEIYAPALPLLDKVGRHAVTVVGTGISADGRRYWTCQDSNVDKAGNHYEYRIAAGTVVKSGVVQDIRNPIPFRERELAQIRFTGVTDVTQQYWTGVVSHETDPAEMGYVLQPNGQWVCDSAESNVSMKINR